MILDELIGKPNGSKKAQSERVQSASRPVRLRKAKEVIDTTDTDSRRVQVKSAVRPSEKPVFEELAIQKGTTLSDLIRDYLLSKAKEAGLL